MNTVEVERLRTPFEQQTDKILRNGITFILRNSPDPRFLPKLAKTENFLEFEIRGALWKLQVRDERNGDQPIRVIILSTIDSSTQKLTALSLITDYEFKNITGLCSQSGSSQFFLPALEPVDFRQTYREIREVMSQRILHSFRQTHSIPRTAQNLGISPSRVRSVLRK